LDAIGRRLEFLSAEARDLLTHASLLGASFTVAGTAKAAEALVAAADLHARRGEGAIARQLFDEALTVYTDLGATWDIRRAVAHFRTYGIRGSRQAPHARTARGPHRLTPTETKVAELVTQGMSNPQIADRPFLSRRTVQSHVSNILTKLDMQSRVDIAREYIRVASTVEPPRVS
jgi:DNA-binding CsgD family transcriptional regulator